MSRQVCLSASARRGPRDRPGGPDLREFNSRSVHPFASEGSVIMVGDSISGRIARLLLASLLTAGILPACFSSRTDPQTGRVRVLFLGEVASTNILFLGWIAAEPQFVLNRIPLDVEWISEAEARRFARIYLPRSQAELAKGYDVSVFEDFTPRVIPISFLDWLQSDISNGMGLALIEYVNWGGTNDIPRWMALQFYEVFPADVVMNDFPASSGRTHYQVMNRMGPLGVPGLESVALNQGHHGDMVPRQGATVEAVWKGRQTLCMVTSTYGRGFTLQLGHGWDNIPNDARLHYTYLIDYIFNQLFYISDLPYPQDLNLVHALRSTFVQYRDRRLATLAVLDFVERFGANPAEAVKALEEVENQHAWVSKQYLEGRYEEAMEGLSAILTQFSHIERQLIRAKERALLWMYVAEWIGVAASLLVCTSLLWTIMVKRKLYKQVATTRGA